MELAVTISTGIEHGLHRAASCSMATMLQDSENIAGKLQEQEKVKCSRTARVVTVVVVNVRNRFPHQTSRFENSFCNLADNKVDMISMSGSFQLKHHAATTQGKRNG